jgi:putative transposase
MVFMRNRMALVRRRSCAERRQRAFKITGLTWIVERSFAWLGRYRRLSKDYEYSVQTSETLIDIAATRLILNPLASA